jgi:hypothetical protein
MSHRIMLTVEAPSPHKQVTDSRHSNRVTDKQYASTGHLNTDHHIAYIFPLLLPTSSIEARYLDTPAKCASAGNSTTGFHCSRYKAVQCPCVRTLVRNPRHLKLTGYTGPPR